MPRTAGIRPCASSPAVVAPVPGTPAAVTAMTRIDRRLIGTPFANRPRRAGAAVGEGAELYARGGQTHVCGTTLTLTCAVTSRWILTVTGVSPSALSGSARTILRLS